MIWTETDRLRLPEGATSAMQQHPTYGAACTSLGNRVQFLELPGPRNRPLGAAQVLLRRLPLLGTAALLSRGPVWAPEVPDATRRAGLHALAGLLRSTCRVAAVTPEPWGEDDPLEGSGWLRSVTPCHLARLDLTGGAAAMRGRQHGKWRNRLVRAEAAGLTVRHQAMPADPSHWLLRQEALQARQRRYRRLPTAFTVAWVRQGGSGAARLFTVARGGMPVASMLFLLHGTSATYHIGWTGPEGRSTGAHNLLLWQAQLWLADHGFVTLDLDLIDTETTPGLSRFKLGSGAAVVALGATWLSAPGTRYFAERQAARQEEKKRPLQAALSPRP